jgi:nucleotide-binding universal stress UspA family protein
MLRNAAQPSHHFLEKLLVATDGSESGDRAVAFSIALALRHESTIEFCDAVDLDGALLSCCTTQGESALMMPLLHQLEDNGESVVAAAREDARAAGILSTSEIPNGRSVAAILDCASDHRFDAVVVGTAGKVGLERIFAGSTADGVVRRSPVPVFVIPPGANVPTQPFENVFVALDDSDPGDAALAFSLRLASADNARLTICSVAETPRLSIGAEYYVYDPQITIRELHEAAETLVTTAYDHARDRNVRCERFVVDGAPVEKILATARGKGADVIVIGTHGRRGLRRWFVGSVAEAIMRRSDVPVVVVRSLVEHAVSAKQSRKRDFAGD